MVVLEESIPFQLSQDFVLEPIRLPFLLSVDLIRLGHCLSELPLRLSQLVLWCSDTFIRNLIGKDVFGRIPFLRTHPPLLLLVLRFAGYFLLLWSFLSLIQLIPGLLLGILKSLSKCGDVPEGPLSVIQGVLRSLFEGLE